jgi:hypothetical protein
MPRKIKNDPSTCAEWSPMAANGKRGFFPGLPFLTKNDPRLSVGIYLDCERYKACSRDAIHQLINNPNITNLISGKKETIERLLNFFNDYFFEGTLKFNWSKIDELVKGYDTPRAAL